MPLILVFGAFGSAARSLARIDAVPGRGEVLEHRGVHGLHLEDDGERIGRLDRADVGEGRLAGRHHALRRIAQPVVGRLDVGRGQRRAVVELDARLELERVGHQVGRDRPGLGEIALDLGELVEVEAQQRRIERRGEVQRRVGVAAVAVVVRRLGADRELQRAAASWAVCASAVGDRPPRAKRRGAGHQDGASRYSWRSSSLHVRFRCRESLVVPPLRSSLHSNLDAGHEVAAAATRRSGGNLPPAFLAGHRAAGMEHAAATAGSRARAFRR